MVFTLRFNVLKTTINHYFITVGGSTTTTNIMILMIYYLYIIYNFHQSEIVNATHKKRGRVNAIVKATNLDGNAMSSKQD